MNSLPTRQEAIKQIVYQRNIQSLIHFTQICNLSSILRIGLMNRKMVDIFDPSQGIKVNDTFRLDGHKEAICLSISFPNYKMFYTYHQNNSNDWVVLQLKPEILWDKECAFCFENAASGKIRDCSIKELKKPEAFDALFQDFEQIERKTLSIPDCFPTNPQAEVLVFNQIQLDYIQKVNFHNSTSQEKWLNDNPLINRELLAINPRYYSYRNDYEFWR